MEFLKLKKIINEKFVSRITILLLGVWIIIISQNKNLPNKNNKNIKTPKITKEIIIEEKNITPKKSDQDLKNEDSNSEQEEQALIAEMLTNAFKDSKKIDNQKTKVSTPENEDDYSVENEKDTELEEIIEVCKSLREEGKTLQSLKKLRDAKLLFPNKPRLLWELHLTYEVMALHQKSQNELNNIIGIGKELGKDYWEIAKLKLTKNQNINTSERKQNFIFGTIIESKPENQKTGEIVIINMEIKSQLKIKPNVKDVSLIIDFYDIVDDVKIQTTFSDQPQATWKTMPIDWTSGKSEIVEWKYHLPSFSTEEKNNIESRRYYGFVSRLYYKDILQDIYANPRTLLEPKQSLNNSFIDSSLFPPVND